MRPRLSHCRFRNGSPCQKNTSFDRVVTIVWSFDGKFLKYGSTIYKKNGKSDFWNKKLHHQKALERYETSPITVELIFVNMRFENINPLAMDWYIADNLLYKYGSFCKESFTYLKEVKEDDLYVPFDKSSYQGQIFKNSPDQLFKTSPDQLFKNSSEDIDFYENNYYLSAAFLFLLLSASLFSNSN